MAFDHYRSNEDQPNPLETAIKSGKTRKTKTHDQSTKKQKKKQARRGMGVAQLEETLRLQEGWQKMTEINTIQNNNPIFVSSCFAEPTMISNAHVPFAKFGAFGVANGGVHLGPNQCLLGHAIGNVGLNQSSTPNIKCVSDYCGLCQKKKLINGANMACSSINGFIFGSNQDFGTRPANHSGYAIGNTDQRVEVVAVHKKGSSKEVVMEYEFFPGKSGKSISSNNDSMMKFGSETCSSLAEMEGEAFYVSTTSGIESSSSIDLSLKLYH